MKYITEEQFNKEMNLIKERNKQIRFKKRLKKEKDKERLFSLPKIKTSNKVLIASILSVVLFTIACLYIQYTTLIEISSTLITLWYSFWTVEIVSLAGIKVSKVFKNYKSENFIDNIDCLSEDGNDDSVG